MLYSIGPHFFSACSQLLTRGLVRTRIGFSCSILLRWPLLLFPALFTLTFFWSAASSSATQASSHIQSEQALDYGTVLYQFFQKDYFNALIEQRVVERSGNNLASRGRAQILKGGMLLSYGLPDQAEALFSQLLDVKTDIEVRNRAWYHLAKLFYSKSDRVSANRALDKIDGKIPADLHIEYHYLASLLKNDGSHGDAVSDAISKLSGEQPHYSYLIFNIAVSQLRAGNVASAITGLEEVAGYQGQNRELLALADRAKHGLSQLATQAGNLPQAWLYLRGIRTTGLYSNRALLSYAWAAINMKLYSEAVPALQLLDDRSIAIPEVQESKVLLAHLYEQEGSPRKALRSNVMAEKAFKEGIEMLAEARRIIGQQDVPREFIENLDAIMDESDWYSAHASVDYKKLTPFLIDLMASHPFNETLKDLAALYTLDDNLSYWLAQTEQHQLILASAGRRAAVDELSDLIARSEILNERLRDQKAEIRLTTLTLEEEQTERFDVVLANVSREMTLLDDKIRQLKKIEKPYQQPASYPTMVKEHHQRAALKLRQTRALIAQLEPVMRKLVNDELTKHEERMRYYWAQSRLAKARLFDSTLLELENAKPQNDAAAGDK